MDSGNKLSALKENAVIKLFSLLITNKSFIEHLGGYNLDWKINAGISSYLIAALNKKLYRLKLPFLK